MKKLLIFLGALAAYGQTISLSDTLTNAVGGGSFTGRITVTLSAPGSAQPLYYSTTSLTGWQAVYCLGVTGSDCTTTTAAGVFSATLYANSTITPAGTSYSARFTPAKGSPWSEVWVVTPSTTTLRQVRSSTVPTPTTTFQPSQIVPGTNGQVLTTTAGATAWGSVPACATCVVTSGSYADPAWITSLAGSKVSGAVASATAATTATSATTATALAANGTNCAAGTFPLGVDASGAAESCTALPTTITGTANQITASASTGAVTLSFPAGGMTLPAQVTVNGLVDQEQLIVNSPAGSIVDIQTWRVNNAVVADITSTGAIELTGSAGVAFEINGGRGTISEPVGGSMTLASGNLSNGNQVFNAGASGAHYWQYGGTTKRYADTNGLWFNNAQTLYWKDSGGTHREILRGQSDDYTGLVSLGNGFKFWSRGFGTARMVLTDGGNLLIGTTTDNTTDKLQVTGSVSASGGFTGALTGNASTATALASTVASGRIWYGNGTGAPGSASAFVYDSANGRLGVGTASPSHAISIVGTSPVYLQIQGSNNNSYLGMVSNVQTMQSDSAIAFKPNSTESARFAATTGNLLIGTTTDSGYKLEVANSGSSGTARFYDATATTGSTKVVVRAGAGQSGNLQEWQNNAGTVLGFVRASDGLLGSTILSTADIQTAALSNSGNSYTAGLNLKSAGGIGWSSTGNWFDTKDTGLARAAAGYLKVTDGSTGLGKIVVSQSTPSASTDACTAGALWADATYIYACTATGVIKRATLASF